MLYLFWYSTFKVLFINALYNYLRQGAVRCWRSLCRCSVVHCLRCLWCVGLVALLHFLALICVLAKNANVLPNALANYSSWSGSAAIFICSSSSLVGYIFTILLSVVSIPKSTLGKLFTMSTVCTLTLMMLNNKSKM